MHVSIRTVDVFFMRERSGIGSHMPTLAWTLAQPERAFRTGHMSTLSFTSYVGFCFFLNSLLVKIP